MSDRDLYRRLEEVERRLAQMQARGRVVAVDYASQPARAKVRFTDGQESNWLPIRPRHAGKAIVWEPLAVGQGVTVISPGDLALGEIITSCYREGFWPSSQSPDEFRIEFEDGASVVYNLATHKFTAVLPAGGEAKIVAPAKVLVETELLEVTGDIKAGKNISAPNGNVSDKIRSMQGDRDIYNQHLHPVSGSTANPTPNKQ